MAAQISNSANENVPTGISAIPEIPGNPGIQQQTSVASSLTTTAGNFFRKYTSQTSSGTQPVSTTIEMSQISNKTGVPKAVSINFYNG